MSYAQRRVEWLVLAFPPAKRSQTLSCSGIIRTCCRCLKYYLTAKNTASPANSPSWLDLDSVPLLINGELPALTATSGAVYWPNWIGGGALGVRFALPSSSLLSGSQFSLYEPGCCIYKRLTLMGIQEKWFPQHRSSGGLSTSPIWCFSTTPVLKYVLIQTPAEPVKWAHALQYEKWKLCYSTAIQ